MIKPTFRQCAWFVWIISAAIFSLTFYFQYVQGMHPCPLCLMQRICIGFVLFFGLPLLFSRRVLISFFLAAQFIFACLGLVFAGRQIWLQTLPSDLMSTCLPGLDMLIKYFPWQDVVHALLWGSAECGEIDWRFWGLSMADWSFIYFLSIALILIYQYRQKGRLKQ